MFEIIKKPLISEKNAGHAEDSNTYAFEVSLKASKDEIKKAIETSFHVKVEEVRTMVCRVNTSASKLSLEHQSTGKKLW